MVIYKTTNTVNNKWYIGKDERNDPKYLGSGTLLRQAIAKYGKDAFRKEILAEANDRDELIRLEIEHITASNAVSDKNSYNLSPGGEGGIGNQRYIDSLTANELVEYKKKLSDNKISFFTKEKRKQWSEKNKELKLHKYMLNGRDVKRKEWWASLSDEERSSRQRVKSKQYWENITEEEMKTISQNRQKNALEMWCNISSGEKADRLANAHAASRKQYRLVKDKDVLTTDNLKETCASMGFNYGSLHEAKRHNKTYKGWKIEEIINGN